MQYILSNMSRKKSEQARSKAIKIFEAHGGVLRTSEAILAGIHPSILYELRDSGLLEQINRGLYALVGLPNIEELDFVTVIKKVPNGVICLLSALYFHGLTVQIPKWVDIAVPRDYKTPRLDHPPVRFHWISDHVFHSSIETHNFSKTAIRIYSPEKTIVDCFRLRRKVGIDIALEALTIYLKEKKVNLRLLKKLAKESRVLRLIEPYLEALTYDQS